MRSRSQIEQDAKYMTWKIPLLLEVLLDIRELLKNKKGGGA